MSTRVNYYLWNEFVARNIFLILITMPLKKNLSGICVYKLTETYHDLFDKQQKLGISDEYLLNTVRHTQQDDQYQVPLQDLLASYKKARDNLIIWYLKQTLVDLNVTISLINAKIKFIEYKLGLSDGFDLHRACSLSLVDFCNILTDMAKSSSPTKQKKTMHVVSKETGLPVWLSHYRNQICHVPSESPCISILVPLVQKSLNYMRESFWTRLMERESFDEHKFRKIVDHVAKLTHIKYRGRQIVLASECNLGKKKMKKLDESLIRYRKSCLLLRRMMQHSPKVATDIMVKHMVRKKYNDESRNNALLLTSLIYARCFERFVFRLIWLAENNPKQRLVFSWLKLIVSLISYPKNESLVENLSHLGIENKEVAVHIDIPGVKCCRIAHRLMKINAPHYRRLLLRMRHKLIPVLGKRRTVLLSKMTRLLEFDK